MVLPQLDTATYYSQLFWLMICFGAVYLFVSKFFVPAMRSRQNQRLEFINNLINDTNRVQNEVMLLNQQLIQLLAAAEKRSHDLKIQRLSDVEHQYHHQDRILKTQFAALKIESDMQVEKLIVSVKEDHQGLAVRNAHLIIQRLTGQDPDEDKLRALST